MKAKKQRLKKQSGFNIKHRDGLLVYDSHYLKFEIKSFESSLKDLPYRAH